MSDAAKITATETRTGQLVMLDQQLALSAYLQALLRPAPVAAVMEGATGAVVEAEPASATAAAFEIPYIEEVTETLSGDLESEATPQPAPAAQPQPCATATPEWAQGEFQCLLFRVAGLTLALPLAKLNGVLPWDADAVTPMPNHQSWFLGLREHLGHQVKLIDVAKVVLPPERAADAAAGLGKVILIDDGRWGLACTEVAEVITLSAQAVKWRSTSSRRPWLAGTVVEHMCALIDSTAFAAMLSDGGPPI